MINRIEKGIFVNFLEILFVSSFNTAALLDSANLMTGTGFYSKLKFWLEVLKRLR